VVDWNDTNVFPRLVDKQSVSCSRSEVRIRHVNNIARHSGTQVRVWTESNWNEHRHIFFFTRGTEVLPKCHQMSWSIEKPGAQRAGNWNWYRLFIKVQAMYVVPEY